MTSSWEYAPKSHNSFDSLSKAIEACNLGNERYVQARPGTKESDGEWNPTHPKSVGNDSLIECGDGLVVIDIDDWEAVPEEMQVLIESTSTFTVQTPHSAGKEGHYYFAVDGNIPTRNPGWGEIRSEGALVVTPGSQITECGYEDCCTPDSPGKYSIREHHDIATINPDELPIEDEQQPERIQYPVDTDEFDFNLRERLERGRECSETLDSLCGWAKRGGNPSSVGYSGRSEAERALTFCLAFWFERNKNAVRHTMNRLNPPKWAERGEDYRESVLGAIENQPETYGGIENAESGSSPSVELVVSVWFDLLNEGPMSTKEVAELADYSQRQTKKALDYLEEKYIVEYKREGRSGRWHPQDGMSEELDRIENELNSLDDRDRYLVKRNLNRFGVDSRE